MGWEEVTPLELDEVTQQDKAVPSNGLSAKAFSFLEVNDPGVVLQTWKAAEDGNGTILRFVEIEGTERKIRIRMPLLEIQEAWKTDAVERDLLRLESASHDALEFTIHPYEIATIRVKVHTAAQRSAEITTQKKRR
jgi:alpha-mannosidase